MLINITSFFIISGILKEIVIIAYSVLLLIISPLR